MASERVNGVVVYKWLGTRSEKLKALDDAVLQTLLSEVPSHEREIRARLRQSGVTQPGIANEGRAVRRALQRLLDAGLVSFKQGMWLLGGEKPSDAGTVPVSIEPPPKKKPTPKKAAPKKAAPKKAPKKKPAPKKAPTRTKKVAKAS